MSRHHGKRIERPGDNGARLPSPIAIQKALGGLAYPASKPQLMERARERGADDAILSTLDRLPEGDYVGPAAISRAMGKLWH
jgi:hypothetical protein